MASALACALACALALALAAPAGAAPPETSPRPPARPAAAAPAAAGPEDPEAAAPEANASAPGSALLVSPRPRPDPRPDLDPDPDPETPPADAPAAEAPAPAGVAVAAPDGALLRPGLDPEGGLRPLPRPGSLPPALPGAPGAPGAPVARAEPDGAILAPQDPAGQAAPPLGSAMPQVARRPGLFGGLLGKLRPPARGPQPPDATPDAPPDADTAPQARGRLCGIPGLEGKEIAPIAGKVAGCGLADGVAIAAVSGIPLSTPAQVDCATAAAFKTWVDEGIVPLVGTRGGGIARLEIAASYVCRPRNNQKGNKISEHGKGRAVDLSGIVLRDGRTLTVAQDWRREARLMRAIHEAACGPFGTVLGPEADRFHHDHFHVDIARSGAAPYCH